MTSQEAYSVLMILRNKSGINAKLEYLSKYPELKIVLEYMFNPYITFGITDPGVKGVGTHNFKQAHIRDLLDELASRQTTGNQALRCVQSAQREMKPESAALLGLILDKNPRLGISAKSINKLWPGLIPTHDVMLCKTFDPAKISFPCRVEPKIDGIRGTVINYQLYTRKGLLLSGLENIEETLRDMPKHEWDGELTVPGCTFQKASGLLRSGAVIPNAQFTIFAARDCNADEYYTLADEIGPQCNVQFANWVSCHSLDQVYKTYDYFRENLFEGAVVKVPEYKYRGVRSWEWMKLKPMLDGEFIIVDTYEGEGKYAGMLGGIVIDFEGRLNRVGTGFSDEQRKDFWLSHAVIGKTAHIEYMETTDDGNMRHSRFKDIRWDK